MPWEETENYIRSGHRNLDEFQRDSLRTMVLDADKGIKAVVGKPKNSDEMEIVSYLFEKSKGWDLDKAKDWFSSHVKKSTENTHLILPFKIVEKILDKPLKVRGIALTVGVSRNRNVYTPEELRKLADKLVSAPVYVEHIAVPNAVGKVVKTEWDGKHLWYEAEIYDEEIAAKIKNELIKHVSIGADYETIDAADGKIPHNLHNAELSLVAVPGVPETNIQVLEKLRCEEQKAAPLIAGDYVLGFYQDVNSFLPQHFSIVWLDKENGILAIFGKTKASPETQRVQSLFFAKEKLWDENKIRDWLSLHPHYMVQAGGFEALLKDPKPMVAVEEVVRMIQNVLPNPVVEHSWGLGSQRLCQELRGIILKLKGELKYAD